VVKIAHHLLRSLDVLFQLGNIAWFAVRVVAECGSMVGGLVKEHPLFTSSAETRSASKVTTAISSGCVPGCRGMRSVASFFPGEVTNIAIKSTMRKSPSLTNCLERHHLPNRRQSCSSAVVNKGIVKFIELLFGSRITPGQSKKSARLELCPSH
jgi:hypothetical protein